MANKIVEWFIYLHALHANQKTKNIKIKKYGIWACKLTCIISIFNI